MATFTHQVRIATLTFPVRREWKQEFAPGTHLAILTFYMDIAFAAASVGRGTNYRFGWCRARGWARHRVSEEFSNRSVVVEYVTSRLDLSTTATQTGGDDVYSFVQTRLAGAVETVPLKGLRRRG